MSKHFVSVKNNAGEYQRFEVPPEVSRYIKQLEACIKYPGASKIRDVYKDRFGGALKSMVTVTQMAKSVKLSRARFYQLIGDGFFPPPTRSKGVRPHYTAKGQQDCIRCCLTGIGIDGKTRVFYNTKQEIDCNPESEDK